MNKEATIEKDQDLILVKGVINGDKQSQITLYKKYYSQVYGAALRILKNPADAEDVMQESFIAAFGKMKGFSGEVQLGAWIRKITVNRSIDFLRKKKVRFVSAEGKVEYIPEEPNQPLFFDDQKLLMETIRNAIMELPDGYRVVLSLHLLEGYDHDEIAEILHINSSTSRSQYSRARQKLAELLKQKEIYS